MTIGERIKDRRCALGISQVSLADRVGVSKQSLYKYENGIITNIPSDKIEEIAKALDTTPSFLMGWDEEQPSDQMPVNLSRQERQMVKAFRKADPVTQQNVCLLLGVSRQDEAAGLSNSKIDA